ncbi:group II intron reverse transcriptase/maturase [Tolypothrix sp. VBCCA 56010]|uniref:group II intron reverse transcriptase/maturase n=1 Tax=Tolypothrix sp. VBCCA 56010 TaxID=3137731 RepID=UPI003D7C5B56
MSKTQENLMVEWKHIEWRKLEKCVFKLQKRIYKASQRGDVKIAHRLQKMLMKSWSAKALSVRRVTQDNQGKKTAGVDGVKSLTPKQRLILIGELKLGAKVNPTRRVWIPKPGTEEKRPLGIPTMKDRALQALVKLALEPEWEARFEPNSYGFRPGRSCQDAISAVQKAINQKAKYVLDADISKCFDRIEHKALLKKINTSPITCRQIRAWLKSGVMDNRQFFSTSEGTPQGGVISPLLANIALHGMENAIKKAFPRRQPRINGKKVDIPPPDVIRYADDFVIFHEDITVVQRCREFMVEWLSGMGLELKPSKTRIAHTLNPLGEEKPGFEFLGYSVRQFLCGRYNSVRSSQGKPQEFKTIITPSKNKQKIHYDQIAKVIERHRGAPQSALISHLNPIIRGWANYYSTVTNTVVFNKLDYLLYQKLRAWTKRRHTNKNWKWVNTKYWQTIGDDNWVFATKHESSAQMRLLKHGNTLHVNHVKVKGEASPYDGNLVYWSIRKGNNPELPNRVAILLKKQKGKCPYCRLFFRENDVMEVDHTIPKSQGGKDSYNNWQLLHRHCHDIKTASDYNAVGTESDCKSVEPKPTKRLTKVNGKWVIEVLMTTSQINEEPDEVKISRPVLKPSMRGDSHA